MHLSKSNNFCMKHFSVKCFVSISKRITLYKKNPILFKKMTITTIEFKNRFLKNLFKKIYLTCPPSDHITFVKSFLLNLRVF